MQLYLFKNQVIFDSGYISVYGRIIEIEENTIVELHPDNNNYGYIVLYVNTYDDTVSLQLKEAISVPTLQQEDISLAQGVFELPLVKYKKTLSSVAILANTEALLVKSIQTIKTDVKNETIQEIRTSGTRRVERTFRSGASHYFDLDLNQTGEVLLMIGIEDTVERIFPSSIISFGPGTGVGYYLNGNWYLAEMIRYDTSVTITTADSSHEVTELWIIK